MKTYFGRVELKDLTAAQVHQFVHYRKMKGAASGTINRDLAALKHMYNFAVQCGVLEANPIG